MARNLNPSRREQAFRMTAILEPVDVETGAIGESFEVRVSDAAAADAIERMIEHLTLEVARFRYEPADAAEDLLQVPLPAEPRLVDIAEKLGEATGLRPRHENIETDRGML